MNKVLNYTFLIILSVLLLHVDVLYSQSFPKYYKTAVKLYKDGYYPESRMLLLTLLYSESLTSPFELYAKFLVAMSYAKETKFSKSILQLKSLQKKIKIRSHKNKNYNSLLCEVNYQIAKLYFYEKKIDLFLETKEYFDSECLAFNKRIINEINTLEIASLIYNMKWDEALNRTISYDLGNSNLKNYLSKKLTEISEHKDKSPVLGGIFSIVPGLGHIYAGRFSDGFRSFLFNLTFSGLTLYTAFQKDYLFTSIFGLIELTLYASNIYGGIDAVMQENAAYYIKNRDKLLKSIPISNIEIVSIRKEIGL